MKQTVVIIFLAVLVFFVSCSDTSGPSSNEFFVKLRVVDTLGNPVLGLDVNFCNKTDLHWTLNIDWPKTLTKITFFSESSNHAAITIYDINNDEVVSLLNDNISAGLYAILWDGKNEMDEKVVNGLYLANLKISNEEDVLFDSTITMLKSTVKPENIFEPTDEKGEFIFYDRKPFLNFFSVGSIDMIDNTGQYLGSTQINDTTVVVLADHEHEKIQFEYRVVKNNRENVFEIVWDPMDESEMFSKNIKPNNSSTSGENAELPQKIKKGIDDEVNYYYHLYQNYPNPFK